jgi:hypothetical protein
MHVKAHRLDLDWFEIFDPLPHQRRLLASDAEARWLCGGRGAGKTWTLVNDELLKALTMPRVPGALLGRVGNDLRTTIEPELDRQLQQLQDATGICWIRKWNRSGLGYLELVNGSRIWLRPYDRIDSLRGLQFGHAGCDELLWTYTVDEKTAFDSLRILLRVPCERPGLLIASSPNGLSPVTREFISAQQRRDRRYFVARARASDNSHIRRDSLAALADGLSRRAYLQEIEGEILRSAETCLPEYDEERHIVDRRWQRLQRLGWPYLLAVDWHTVAFAIYVDPSSRQWVVADELTMRDSAERKITPDRFWAHLVQFVKKHGRPRAAFTDRALPKANNQLRQLFDGAVPIDWCRTREEQAVELGLEELRDWLDPYSADESTPPRIVLSSSLKRERPDDQRVSPLRHALREYRWLKTRQGQITGKPDKNDRDDHAVDALRYAVVCAGRRHREWVDGEAQPRAWTRNADRATVRYG